MSQTKSRKKQAVSKVGRVTILATKNNTHIHVAGRQGETIYKRSTGMDGVKGTRKATAHAAEESAKVVGSTIVDLGVTDVSVVIKGVGLGRDSAVKGILSSGLKIIYIKDATPDPHAGVRLKKKRRG